MVINAMFIYHFVDPYLGVEKLFEKEGATKNEGTYHEIGA